MRKIPRMKEGDRITIRWRDIFTENKWTNLAEARVYECPECVDEGCFLSEDEESIRIFNSISHDGQCGFTVFPRGVIIEIKKLRG